MVLMDGNPYPPVKVKKLTRVIVTNCEAIAMIDFEQLFLLWSLVLSFYLYYVGTAFMLNKF